MEIDFPAAHSMDTIWFAVDDDGHIGCFHTGENGSLPEGAGVNDELVRAWIRSQLPDPPEEIIYLESFDYADNGLFCYGYGNDWSGIAAAYERELSPENPRHIDQVPPAVRAVFNKLHLKGLRFVNDRLVQPCEHGHCHFYYEDETTGYLARDGVTVRPLPGRERHFLEDYEGNREQLAKYQPELLQRLRFELPREEDLPPAEDEEEDD
jgi:hypothetical protein